MSKAQIFIINHPHLNDWELVTWCEANNVPSPVNGPDGMFYLEGELGKVIGKHLQSLGWVFQVAR